MAHPQPKRNRLGRITTLLAALWIVGLLDPANTLAVLRTERLEAVVSPDGSLQTLHLLEHASAAEQNQPQESASWFLGDERIDIDPSTVRREDTHYEAMLVTPSEARLSYRLEGSVLTITVQSATALPLASPRFELPQGVLVAPFETEFSGLANYYNGARPISVNGDGGMENLELPYEQQAGSGQWFGHKSRYFAALISAPGATIRIEDTGTTLSWAEPMMGASVRLYLGNPANPAQADPAEMAQVQERLRYGGLIWPLRKLCLGVDWILRLLYALVANWGVAIILASVLMRLFLIPVNRQIAKYQKQVNSDLSVLEPKFAAIKQEFDGQQAHERMMTEYKALGITPFHTLKPMIGVFIQLPLLIAIFNVLGELEAVRGIGFLWIRDLSYPDSIAMLPFVLPLLGSGINLLPTLMTLISISASWTQPSENMTPKLIAQQRRNLLLMATGFFFLFYPFPASMVLYWTTSNALQFIEQTVRRR